MNKQPPSPRYLTIARELQDRITNGHLVPGAKLPSEAELASEYGISRGTAVRAIEQLVQEGLAHRKQGAGSFVSRHSLRRRTGLLLSFTESVTRSGLAATQRLLSLEQVGVEQAIQFRCDEDALFLQRLRLIDGSVCAIHRTIIPLSVASRVEGLELPVSPRLQDPDFSLYSAYQRAGLNVVEADERVATRLASQEECALLQVSAPCAVMIVFRRSFDPDGQLIEATEATYQGDYFSYDMRLVMPMSKSLLEESMADEPGGWRVKKPQ